MGSLKPLVPTSSKAFVQFQKVHRIIHLMFRTVQHSFDNTSPETNHFLRQSDIGLVDYGLTIEGSRMGKMASSLKDNSFSISLFTSLHGCHTALVLNIWSHDDVFLNAHNKNNEKYKITHYLSQIISLLTGWQKKNHPIMLHFRFLLIWALKITWFALSGHMITLPVFWLVENKKVWSDIILDMQMSRSGLLIGRKPKLRNFPAIWLVTPHLSDLYYYTRLNSRQQSVRYPHYLF